MERNSGESKSSLVPYESNFEEQKQDSEAALCLCSFAIKKLDHQTAMELKAVKARNLRSKCRKRSAASRIGTRKTMEIGNVEKFPEAGKGIDGCILPELPPVESLNGLIGICSKPFEKQLSRSDLKESQNRLLFNTADAENFLRPLLNSGEDLDIGVPVIVYDSEGRKHPMTFKVWHGRAYVLFGKWIEFARNHGFEEATDWITVWMFRHITTQKLCFVIISRRFSTFEMVPRRNRTGAATAKVEKRRGSGSVLKREYLCDLGSQGNH